MVDDRTNALFSFDGFNKRLYLHTTNNEITSYNLDGSDATTIVVENVEFFTVDGRNNLIYYHHSLQERIWVYNITSGQQSSVDALADIAGVKDLEMDLTNG